MATYEIYGPLTGDRGAIAETLRATSPGFSYAAFVFGPFWLAAYRLWAPLAIYLAAAALVAALASIGTFAPGGVLGLELTAALFIGFEGPNWRGAALARRGRQLLGLVEAGCASDAADLFILRNLAGEEAAPPAATPPLRRSAPQREPQVLGLFPEARRP